MADKHTQDTASASQAQQPTEDSNDASVAAEAPAAAGSDVQELNKQLNDARMQAEEHWEKLLRTQAELENLRKRSKRDIENAHKFGIEKFITELLPVKDSLELGLDAANEQPDAEKLRKGTELTLKILEQVLEKFNVHDIDPMGEKFDPDKHQAMTMQESVEHEPNIIIGVMQKGYILNDRLIRPAMVIVSKTPQGETSE